MFETLALITHVHAIVLFCQSFIILIIKRKGSCYLPSHLSCTSLLSLIFTSAFPGSLMLLFYFLAPQQETFQSLSFPGSMLQSYLSLSCKTPTCPKEQKVIKKKKKKAILINQLVCGISIPSHVFQYTFLWGGRYFGSKEAQIPQIVQFCNSTPRGDSCQLQVNICNFS